MLTKASVWWPGISSAVQEMIQQSQVCAKDAKPTREPLIPSPLLDYPWQVVGLDLFELHGKQYLLLVDYFSRYPEVVSLPSATSNAVISAIRPMFARHGIPEVLRSDNGPQYASEEFEKFAKTYGFSYNTSSPHFPQSNGLAEWMVKTVKQLLQHSSDLNLALLTYRSTPLPWCNLSPAELLMGRRIRSRLPLAQTQLLPKWSYLPDFQATDKLFKQRQKRDYDQHHRVRALPVIPDGSEVWVKSGTSLIRGQVQGQLAAPRSYLVNTPSGTVRRNRFHLSGVPEETTQETQQSASPEPEPTNKIMTRMRTGTEIRLPQRYRDSVL